MARSIANFLVGIGLDTTDWDKGARKVDTNLSSFRSKAGIAGGAIAAAFSAASIAAIKAGDNADKFALKVAKFDTSRRFIYNLGNAFKMMGGNAEEAVSAIASAEGVLDQLRKGDASALTAAGLAQVDVSKLQQSATGEEFLMNLSELLPGLQKWQQRSLQETFGLSDAAMKTLQDGRGRFEQLIADADKYADNLDKAAQAGREYNEALAKIGIQFEYIAQKLADGILPQFTSLLNGFSAFIDKNMSKVGAAADYISENAGAVAAVGGGLTLATVGSAVQGIGSKLGIRALTAAGTGAAYAGAAGAAAGVGSILYDLKASDIKDMTGYDVSPYYRAPSETVAAIADWWRGDSKKPSERMPDGSVNKTHVTNLSELARSDESVPNLDWYKSNLSQAARYDESVPSPDWYKGSATTPEQVVMRPSLSQQARSDESVPQPIVIDNRITLDGRELARWKKEQDALVHYATIDEISSTVAR